MKNTFFEKNKKAFGIAACIFVFALITLVYFNPILEGKRLKQHDIEMNQGMSKEILDYYANTGDKALWTNSMFGGMPAWNIYIIPQNKLMSTIHRVFSAGFPNPFSTVFISMLGFFILLLVLDCSIWTSFIGGLAYGLTSYLFIIIGAGHNTKAIAMAYMAPVIAGILLTYKGKYLWGSIMTSIAMAMEVRANHLQITYYLLIIVVCIVISVLINSIKEKCIGSFIKASMCLLVAAIIGIMTNITTIYANYEFGKETTRGKPILTQNQSSPSNQTTGLDRDYITQWSYGKGETWSLLIPNAKGGASGYIGKQNPALDKADRQFRDSIAQSNAYWGDQPGTSGPVYVGAIIVFLFVLGALTVKGELKWALLAATLLSILLSWGKNFMGFTDFFIDYVPGYNKFRAVSMTLVIAEVCMPMLGLLGLAEIVKSPEDFKKNLKRFWIALGTTAGICLLFYIAPKLFFSFLSQGEAQQFAQLTTGKDGAMYASFASQLEDVRIAIFRKDAIRSFFLILLAAIPLFLYGKGKLKAAPAFMIIAALVVTDLYPIDKRYLNNSNFISRKQFDKPFVASVADNYILADNSLDFRVINLTKDVFNDASTSYFHKSVGGYHGAKQRRYQDLINGYLNPEIRQFSALFKSVDSELTLRLAMEQQRTLNMLNTKYIIYNPESEPIENPCAFGNAWIVNDIHWVNTPDEEFDAIRITDLKRTAIINKEYESQLVNFKPSGFTEGRITMTDYRPNQVTYQFNSLNDQLVVFSEIWTEKGWIMRIDGKEHPILRSNYLLRAALIPAGEHEIVMHYEPRIWKVGNVIANISWALIIMACLTAAIISLTKRLQKNKATY